MITTFILEEDSIGHCYGLYWLSCCLLSDLLY